ncbi:hypothetical protein GZ77_24795 [Endozoicomonas montiporae]|uniref:Uncharacterized protein n=1 Tax=Endozoicomonas montiporae TaxID=1027273 RepID=A0A081MZV5_9GAMM|nr:hypothetical protein GZ77_24795 [Endozoicomonas montiporae]
MKFKQESKRKNRQLIILIVSLHDDWEEIIIFIGTFIVFVTYSYTSSMPVSSRYNKTQEIRTFH